VRDDQLLVRLAQLHGLDWSRLQAVRVTPIPAPSTAEVAEELLAPLGLSRPTSERRDG
jgi:hypothetical protein